MNKKKIIFSILLITLIFLSHLYYVQADSYDNPIIEMIIDNPKMKKGEEFEVILKSNEPFDIGALTGKITFDTNALEYIQGSEEGIAQIEKGTKWLSVIVNSNNSTISAITSQEIEAQQTICKIKLRAKKNLLLKNDTIKLENVNLVNSSYENKTLPTVELKIQNPVNMDINIVIISIIIIITVIILLIVLVVYRIKKKTKES